MDYNMIFDAVMALVMVIITGFIVPWLKAKTTAEQKVTQQFLVEMLVAAAQQTMATKPGAERLKFVTDYFDDHGIDVTIEEIEAAVYWLKQQSDAITEETEVNVECEEE